MIPMSEAQKERHMKSTTLSAKPRLIAEWNLNRASGGGEVKNHFLVNQIDEDYFSLDSVIKPSRPPRGIVKALTSASGLPTTGSTTTPSHALNSKLWSYTASSEDKYRHWLSPNRSSATATGGNYNITNAGIEVIYDEPMPVNKFRVTFETSFSTPQSITVEYKSGSDWIGTTFTSGFINLGTGRVEIYRQAGGSFSTAFATSAPVMAKEFRLTINSLDKANAYAAVIEFSPRLVLDLTERIATAEVSFEVSDSSHIAPIGVASSNAGTVVLDNFDDFLSEDNTSSFLNNVHRRGAKVSLYAISHDIGESPVDDDEVPIFQNMLIDRSDETDGLVEWQLRDKAVILQESKPPRLLIQGETVAGIIVNLCHSVGFNDIQYDINDINDRDTYSKIEYYWTDPDKSVWENIQDVAQATQTAVYFDEYGFLQILTRATAYKAGTPVVWVFDADEVVSSDVSVHGRSAGEVGKLADIVTFSESNDELSNVVDVSYKKTEISKEVRGTAPMEVAWEPEGDVVLRAARVVANIDPSDAMVSLEANDAKTWPYSGHMLINGEVIKYNAKRYSYYQADGTKASAFISSDEEREARDRLNPGRAWGNAYTGHMRIDPRGGRGAFGSTRTAHLVGGPNYTVRRRIGTGAIATMPNSLVKNYSLGYATLSTGSTAGDSQIVARRNMTGGTTVRLMGTRVLFPTGSGDKARAGIVYGVSTNDSGLYIELAKTTAVGARGVHHELNIYWKATNGTIARHWGKGVEINVADNVWYDIDLSRTGRDFTVYINGRPVRNFSTTTGNTTATFSNTMGFFHKGTGSARFECFYSLDAAADKVSQFDFPQAFDIVKGGFKSYIVNSFARWAPTLAEETASWEGPGSVKAAMKTFGAGFFLDEFGLIAHEVREYDVKFENAPMLHSRPYISNSSKIDCPVYYGSPFAAKFLLVNMSRRNEVANGEDTITYGADNSVDQKLLIYGRRIKQEEPQEEERTNESNVIKDGAIELSIESDWIQSKEHAERLAEWAVAGVGRKVAEATVFANPNIQLLDLVGVQYAREFKTPVDHKYYIVGKRISYNGGLEMDISLRSVL